MSKLLRVIVSAASVALLSNLVLFHRFGSTGVVLSLFIFLAYLLVAYWPTYFHPYVAALAATVVVYGGLTITRASETVTALLTLSMMGALFLIAYLLGSGRTFIHSVGELLFVPLHLMASYLVAALETLAQVVQVPFHIKHTNASVKNHGFSAVLGGIAAIPILLILVGLLSAADPIFNKTITNLFSFLTWNQLYTRIVVTSVLFVGLVPWGVLKIRASDSSPLSVLTSKNAVVPLIIIMGSVVSVLLLFLLVQWPYIFAHVAAEADLSKFGVATYSEYVKRGFTEFLMVAAIVYSLLWMGLTAYRSHPKKEGKVLFVIQTVATVLFAIFIVSVLRRIFLYWDLHGLSLIRIYGGLFLLLVFSLTITVYLRHITKIRFVAIELASVAVFLCILGLWNQEAFIVHNHPPTVNGKVDYVYLSRLSADGVDGWIKSFQFAQNELLRNELYDPSLVPLTSEQTRRDVAYAGFILSIFTKNYHALVVKYGTPVEKAYYQQALAAWHTQAINESLGFLASQPSSFHAYGGDTAMRFEPLSTYQQGLTKFRDQTQNVAFRPRSAWSVVQFSNGSCGQWLEAYSIYDCVPSFYTIESKPLKAMDSFANRVFVWNMSELQAYQKLRESVPVDTLMSVQKEYTQIWKNILMLTLKGPGQVNYSLDISLDTPLIKPIR